MGVRDVGVCSVSAEGQLGLQVLVPPCSRKEMCAVGTELPGKAKRACQACALYLDSLLYPVIFIRVQGSFVTLKGQSAKVQDTPWQLCAAAG